MSELAVSTLPVLETLAQNRQPFFTWLFNRLTYLGDEKLFVVIALIVFWCFSKHGGFYMLTTGFASSTFGMTLKMAFRVPRPWNLADGSFQGADPIARGVSAGGTQDSGIAGKIGKFLGAGADGWSFPSGHTLISVGTYGALAAWFKKPWVRVVGILLALLIPFTRIYLGVHTVLDIGCGALIALILVLALKPVFAGDNTKRIRAVLIGNVVLSVITLIYVYLTVPTGMVGEDIDNYASCMKNLWQLLGATLAMVTAFEMDERFLHFDTKAVWWAQILKVIGGSLIVLLLQTAVQKIFGYSRDLLTMENVTKMGIIACAANFVALVAAMGFWPMTFKWFAKLGQAKSSIR